MTLITIIIIGLLFYTFNRIGLNSGSIIGGIIGMFIGSSLGIAGGGAAVSGIAIFGSLGFIIGGLMKKKKERY